MLWLLLLTSLSNLFLVGFLLWMLFQLFQRVEAIQRQLGAFVVSGPSEDARPLPSPGTIFLVSDAEVAHRERLLRQSSHERADRLAASVRPSRSG